MTAALNPVVKAVKAGAPADPYIALQAGQFQKQSDQVGLIGSQLAYRNAAAAQQWAAANKASQAAEARQGANRVQQYQQMVQGEGHDLASNGAGIFGSQLAGVQRTGSNLLTQQNANNAAYGQAVAATDQAGWNDRATQARDLTTQSRASLLTQLSGVNDQIKQAEAQAAAAAASGGGGGGGGRRGGGRGGSGGSGGSSGGLSYTDASRLQAAMGRDWNGEALQRYHGSKGGMANFLRNSNFGSTNPGNVSRNMMMAYNQWDLNKARGIKNGYGRSEIGAVYGQLKNDFGAYNTEQRRAQLLHALEY